MQSYILDFIKSPSFFLKWNVDFSIATMGTDTFRIVLVDDVCQDNIENCINNDGELLYTGAHIQSENCSLSYVESGNTVTISLANEVSFDLTDVQFSMKGVFLTTDSGYVMGYSINPISVNVTNSVIFEEGLVFWTIMEENIND